MKKKIFVWCSDVSNTSGEGILALKFIKDLKKYNKNYIIEIKSPKNKIIIFFKNIFGKTFERFFMPFLGILYLWWVFLFKSNCKISYVNYLPLWNVILFVALPPNTILGPITGGSKYNKTFINILIRGFFFKIFYFISSLILNLRQKKILFSTSLLKQDCKFYSKKKYFNYVFKDFKYNKKKSKKKYDLILYLRNHKNKSTHLLFKLGEHLSENYKIVTVGKKILKKNIINLGKINQKKLYKFIVKTKYTLISTENLYSLFCIDCLKNGVHVLYHKEINPTEEIKKNMTRINYNKFPIKRIKRILNQEYKEPKKIVFKNQNYYDDYFM